MYADKDAKEVAPDSHEQKADQAGGFDEVDGIGAADLAESAAYRFAPMGEAGRRRAVVLLLIVIFLRSGVHGSLMTFIPLYFTNYAGHSAAYGSMLLTVFLLFGAAGTALGGAIADKIGPRKTSLPPRQAMAPHRCNRQNVTT